MGGYVTFLEEIDRSDVTVAGGKGAALGELARLDGIRVPAGFCVTTDAFRRIMSTAPRIDEQLDALAGLELDDREAISAAGAAIRRTIEAVPMPDDLAAAITAAVARLGGTSPCAVRSSATAEDLPRASFAGQQDSYLNISGPAEILRHVHRCWASLFTDRAVAYRLRNRFDHRRVFMAVVVQQMVSPQASGVLFTADPVSSNRKITSVEAGPGLGDGLVSGLVTPDVFKVRNGEIIARPVAAGRPPVLTDAQVVRLEALGRRIEAHFGRPQDIEWCLADDDFAVVQSRPITTLFPVPEAGDDENHVYISVGHQQMMTDAMKPLGLSLWLLTTRAPMQEAGGRLFVDATRALASPASRAGLVEGFSKTDPLTGDALRTIVARGDFIPPPPDNSPGPPPAGGAAFGAAPARIETDPAIVTALIERTQASIAQARREIRPRTGAALIDFILSDLGELKRILFDPQSHEAIMAGMEATWWLNDHLEEWLGERNAADTLTQSAPHNVTSEMGLALLDVADVIRRHPAVVAFLEHADDDGFLEELRGIAGGQ
ncbi:MAG TPA: PEP/pyruvate-binding domain-containing protein, partial [Acidimicrobiia bacterium]|nr:PEP/pyruvate-binding domain-containing protein [Acidimicrobiia bacterium]